MKHMIINPSICHGKPTIKRTRIMVANIFGLLAGGYTFAQVQEYYPELSFDSIPESIQYAVNILQDEEILEA